MTPRLCAYCSHFPYWLASLPWPTTKSESESDWRWHQDPVITLGSWRWMQAQATLVQAEMTAEAEARKEAGEEIGGEVATQGEEVAGTGRNQTDHLPQYQETNHMKRFKEANQENDGNGSSEGGGEGQGGGGGGERGKEEEHRQENKMGGGCHLCLMITKFTDRGSRLKDDYRAYYLPPVMNPRTDERVADVPLVFGRRGEWRWNSERKKDGTRGQWDWMITCVNNEDLFLAHLVRVPGSWCPKYQPLMGYNDQNPENNFLLLKDWLRNCRRNHTECREIKKTSMDIDTDFLPTRLLDVRAFGTGSGSSSSDLGDDVRLVCLNSSMGSELNVNKKLPPAYFTLSHCWGPPEKRPATTTKANLAQRMERISFSELPRTFRDAIKITRKLGHRYLWIDSLCIIQDDEQDWAYEAALMAKIYSYASCMLSALSSNDSSEGLRLEPLDEDRSYMDLVTTSHASPAGGSGTIKSNMDELSFWCRIIIRLEHWGTLYNSGSVYRKTTSPLCLRAWTLQERSLSRRIIHFAKDQVLWECAELGATAQQPWHYPIYSAWDPELLFKKWAGLKESLERLSLVQGHDGKLVPSAAAVNSLLLAYRGECSWWGMVGDYSDRLITKDTDRLPALSGIAQFYQQNYFAGQRYVAGLWSARLQKELLWDVDSNLETKRPAEYVAPSWSWASIVGRVKFNQPDLDWRFKSQVEMWKLTGADKRDPADDAKNKELDREEEVRRVICEEWKVEEINLVPKYDDPYGALKGGSLVIGGARLVEVELFTETMDVPAPDFILGYDRYYGGLKINDRWVAHRDLDIQGEVEGGCILWCWAMEEYPPYHGRPVIEGLILREERVGDDGDVCVYSRVGKFRNMAVALFAGVEPRRIKLI